jgi:putative hydroxymethylpyrimidine transport system permease protein
MQLWPTACESIVGLLFATLFGSLGAIFLAYFPPARVWLLPSLVLSQALPTFAIAPLLVVWLGYGLASKIVTVMIMLFFPITTAFYDGLTRINPGWLDLAYTMHARRWRLMYYIKIPAALPGLASGLRIAAAAAPLGAVIGEWVGASQGLGYLMLNSNARLQVDTMFAALVWLVVLALSIYSVVDCGLKRICKC